MSSLRLAAAVASGKLTGGLSRSLRRGGGTTLPGAVASRVEPNLIRQLTARLSHGSILVTGTNGKTTTARMISAILKSSGRRPVHNRAGANLLAGVASALVRAASPLGSMSGDTGLFEVDEAAMPAVAAEVSPRVVVITNLFRDQLDRYGEVDYLAAIWTEAMSKLPPEAILVLNTDDPLVASVGGNTRARLLYFGLDDLAHSTGAPLRNADARNCPCGGLYEYESSFYAHLGRYRCPQCGRGRPQPHISITEARLDETSSQIILQTSAGHLLLRLRLPGLYNVYNATAAAATGLALGIPAEAIVSALEDFTAAFGRVEQITAGDRHIYMALVKNPVGFDEVLRTVLARPDEKRLLIMINDNLADGTDISWLWDVDFERLAGQTGWIIAAGTRAEDMAVRLKYAGVDMDRVEVIQETAAALAAALQRTPAGETLCLLPTYTAMLDVREEMARRGFVGRFWED